MIDVALTPAQLQPSGIAVVIDVLRATSTATQALAAGYRRVLFADSLKLAARLRTPERVLAGERRCVMPPGFDLGNSPCGVRRVRGEELVLATTNGTPAVVAAAHHAPKVLLACLLNLDAVIEALRGPGAAPDGDVQLVCSGTDGAIALEDVYVAGRLCGALDGPRSDAALVAEAVARAYPTPFEALAASADAAALSAAGLAADVADCANVSVRDVVPEIIAASADLAVAASGPRERGVSHERAIDSSYTVGI